MVKLCFVMPQYSKKIGSHYYYTYHFAEYLGEKLDLFLIIESVKDKPKPKNIRHLYTRRFSDNRYFPLNLIESFLILLYARARGYSTFYMRHSFAASIFASLIVKFFGGRTFMWHCGNRPLPIHFSIALKLASYIITCVNSQKEYYEKNYGKKREKIKVVPNWADLERFDPKKYDKEDLRKAMNIPNGWKVCLYIHSLGEHYGTHLIPGIVKNLRSEMRNVVFLIVGGGPLKKRLKDWVEYNNLKNSVRILGKVPSTEIPKYFTIADVFILPARGPNGRAFLESMAMGVPLVTLSTGGKRSFLPPEYYKFAVGSEDPKKLSARVVELLKNKRLRSKLRRAGLKHVKRYRKKLVRKRFLQVIKESI